MRVPSVIDPSAIDPESFDPATVAACERMLDLAPFVGVDPEYLEHVRRRLVVHEREREGSLRSDGQTVMFVAVDGKAMGLLGVADPIKESAADAIRVLREEGIRIVMLTGDSRTTAEAVAKKLGLDDVIAGVLPDKKADVVKQLQAEGRFVAMAGD